MFELSREATAGHRRVAVTDAAAEGTGPTDPSHPTGAGAPNESVGPTPTSASGDPVALLERVVAELRGRMHTDLPGALALAETRRLLVSLEQLTAVKLAWLADMHSRQLHQLEDAPTAGAWLAREQVDADRGLLALAKRLDRVPAVAEAVAAGGLSLRTAELVAASLDKVRRHVDRPGGLIDGGPAEEAVRHVVVDGVLSLLASGRGGWDDADPQREELHAQLSVIAGSTASQLVRLEGAFLVLAGHLAPTLLRDTLDVLVDALLPLQLEDRAARAHAHRAFSMVRNSDGSGFTVTRGHLDFETGELLLTVLAAEKAVDPDNPVDTRAWAADREADALADARQDAWPAPAKASPAEPARPPRSRAQQDHDALRLALRRSLDSGVAGLRDKVAPHVTVTLTWDQLHDARLPA